jgi:cellulose biosynthesis protein BcsQ
MQELERFRSREELQAAREEMAGWYRSDLEQLRELNRRYDYVLVDD